MGIQKIGRKVKCLDTGRVYSSVAEAAKDLGISENTIYSACSGAIQKAGKRYSLEYVENLESQKALPKFFFIRPYGKCWGVFYKDTLLKAFKTQECACVYAMDSALDDVRILGLVTQDTRMVHRIRHIETGKIYPSIKQAGEALGISPCGIGRVLNGLRETVKGQHFERVKEE